MMDPEQKLTFWQKVGRALTEQLETTISAFVTGTFFTSLFFIIIALPNLKQTIQEYKELMLIYQKERDYWHDKYQNSPNEFKGVYQMLEDLKENKQSIFVESERSRKIIEEQNRKLEEYEIQQKSKTK